jgi:hypothetical protein
MTARAGRWIAVLAGAAILASACSGTNPTASAVPTLRLASGLEPAPSGPEQTSASLSSSASATSAAASAAPSVPGRASARPSNAGASAFASAVPSSGEEPFPNADEQTLLDHVKATLRPSCQRADRFYAGEIDSVSCGGDTAPFVDYTLFPSVDELRAAYTDDVASSESRPVTGGTCAGANYDETYNLSGAVAGRLQCTTRTSSGRHYKVMEWTRESLQILGYISSETATWAQLIDFWKMQAGPIE